MNAKSLVTIISITLLFATKPLFSHDMKSKEPVNAPTGLFTSRWTISEGLYKYILSILPEGSSMIEFGSGWGSEQLSKHYKVWSVEHNPKWLNKYETNYIYAPIENGWYSIQSIIEGLPKQYDLILVDGPTGRIGRDKFFDHLAIFNTDATIIFDDVNRKREYNLMVKVANHLGRKFTVYKSGSKKFGVLLKDQFVDNSA